MDEPIRKLIANLIDDADYHMAGLSGGQLSVSDWQQSFARSLLTHHYAAYMQASESNVVPEAARKRLNSLIGNQVDRLNAFADVLDTRDPTEADAARLRLYAEAIKASYSMGATGDFSLPAYPGDGSTPCIGHCGCAWEDRIDGWYWVRGKSDSCAECVRRAGDWAPYKGAAH